MKTYILFLLILPVFLCAQMSPDVIDPGFTFDRLNPSSLSQTVAGFEPETFYPSTVRVVVLEAATLKKGVQIQRLSATGTLQMKGSTRSITGIVIADKQGISPVPTPHVGSNLKISPLSTPATFPDPTNVKLFVAVPASALANAQGAVLDLVVSAIVQEPGKRSYTRISKVTVKNL